MKIIKTVFGRIWKKYFQKFYFRNIKFRHIFRNNKDSLDVFNKIYKNHYWKSNESKSGKGSSKKNTEDILSKIKTIIKDFKIKTFLDVPCGDCNWIDPNNIGCEYLGGDIVVDLVEINKIKFPNCNFNKIDITKDEIPRVDLIFCRECLQHLSNDNIFKALNNFKKSGSKYFLTSTYIYGSNIDIQDGMFFEINLDKAPFNLGNPILKIEERNNNIFFKRVNKEYLYLYDLQKLKL